MTKSLLPDTDADRLVADIGNHISDRVRAVLRDGADTFDRAEVAPNVALSAMVSVLLLEAVNGAIACRIPEKDLLETVSMTYRMVVAAKLREQQNTRR